MDKNEEKVNIFFDYKFRNEYINSLKYFKEIYTYLYLFNDKNSQLTIKAVKENFYIINSNDFGEFTYSKKDIEFYKVNVDIMNWLVEMEEANSCKLHFELDEFMKKRPFLLILFNAYNNKSTKLEKEIILTMPNKNVNLIINKDYHFMCEFEYIDIFNERLLIPLTKTLNFYAKVIEISDTILKFKLYKTWVSNDFLNDKNVLLLKE